MVLCSTVPTSQVITKAGRKYVPDLILWTQFLTRSRARMKTDWILRPWNHLAFGHRMFPGLFQSYFRKFGLMERAPEFLGALQASKCLVSRRQSKSFQIPSDKCSVLTSRTGFLVVIIRDKSSSADFMRDEWKYRAHGPQSHSIYTFWDKRANAGRHF